MAGHSAPLFSSFIVMTRKTVVVALALMATMAAQAQIHQKSDDSTSVGREVSLDPVVVTGSGHHQHLRSSATPVHVVDKREIESSGAATFEEVLTRLMPQLSAAPNSMGSFLRMNGLGNKYIAILLNGHKIAGDISGNTDLTRINMSRVKRIEILDGAASALYGSDAIGGVINIITEQPTDETVRLSSSTRVAGKGQLTQSVGIDIYSHGIGSYTSFEHNEANSWRNNPYEYVEGDEGETQLSVAPLSVGYASNVASQRLTYTPTRSLALHAAMGYSWKKTDRPESSDDVDGGYDYELRSEGWRWNAGGVYKLGGKNSLLFEFTSDKYEYGHEYDVATDEHDIGDYTLTKDQRLLEAELKGIFSAYEGSTTVAGVDWRRDKMNSVTGDVDESANTLSGYVQHETRIAGRLSATASLRYNWHEAFGSRLTPKVALMWAPGDFNFRLTYSQGYRSPGLDELYYHYSTYSRGNSTITIGNSELDPEKSHYLSLNAEYSSRVFSIALTGYVNMLTDMIVKNSIAADEEEVEYLRALFPDMSQEQADNIKRYSVYGNSDKGRVAGVQASIALRPLEGLSIALNYSYTRARYKEEGGDWQALERSIRNTLTLTASYSHTWRLYTLGLNISGRLQSKTYYPDYENAPGFGIWNINTTHRIEIGRKVTIEPTIGIDNVFDKKDKRVDGENTKYANYSSGRLLTVGLRLEI